MEENNFYYQSYKTENGSLLLLYNITDTIEVSILRCLASNGKSDEIEVPNKNSPNMINSRYEFSFWNPKLEEIEKIKLEKEPEPCPENCECYEEEVDGKLGYDELKCKDLIGRKFPTDRPVRKLEFENCSFSILKGITYPETVIELKFEKSQLLNTDVETDILKQLENISYLSLNGNNLTRIPDAIQHLQQLQSIAIVNNSIETVDWAIVTKLEHLMFLNLSSNLIKNLASENEFNSILAKNSKIKIINLRANTDLECSCKTIPSYPRDKADIIEFDCNIDDNARMSDIISFCQQTSKSNSGLKEIIAKP